MGTGRGREVKGRSFGCLWPGTVGWEEGVGEAVGRASGAECERVRPWVEEAVALVVEDQTEEEGASARARMRSRSSSGRSASCIVVIVVKLERRKY